MAISESREKPSSISFTLTQLHYHSEMSLQRTLAPPEFGVSEKRTKRDVDSLILFISPLRFEKLTTSLPSGVYRT